jgi:hypothetical protein
MPMCRNRNIEGVIRAMCRLSGAEAVCTCMALYLCLCMSY